MDYWMDEELPEHPFPNSYNVQVETRSEWFLSRVCTVHTSLETLLQPLRRACQKGGRETFYQELQWQDKEERFKTLKE